MVTLEWILYETLTRAARYIILTIYIWPNSALKFQKRYNFWLSQVVVISEFKNNKIIIAKASIQWHLNFTFKNLFFLCEIELCILHFLYSQTSNASNYHCKGSIQWHLNFTFKNLFFFFVKLNHVYCTFCVVRIQTSNATNSENQH